MNDMSNDPDVDPDLETRVRQAMRTLAETHQPSSSGPPVTQPTDDASPTGGTPRRIWMSAAATLLVLGGVVAVFAVTGRDTSTSPVATAPPVTDPNEPGETTNADRDVAIDPAALRFSEPLPDDMVAFVNDTSLLAPSIAERSSVAGPAPQQDSIRVVVMDGPRLVMRGIVVDYPSDSDLDDSVGSAVEIGVDGAAFLDADAGGITIPIGDGHRIVGPDEFFNFGGGGPYVDPDDLVEIATAVGQRPLDHINQLPGFFISSGWVGGETLDPLGVADATTVEHGLTGSRLTLYRLAEPPTPLELLAIGHALFRSELDEPAIGDVALTSGGQFYLELVSPVDIVVLSASVDQEARIAAIDFSPADELAEAFNGSVTAPPRPAP